VFPRLNVEFTADVSNIVIIYGPDRIEIQNKTFAGVFFGY